MKSQFKKNKKKFDSLIRYSSMAFEMMGMIALGTFLGYKIDQWMENEFKGFTLGLMILSVIGAIYYSIRNLLKK
ncbi:MAG: AtpZ/AtpI family protein [Mariniphaga sp.]|jgi:F0F1-type ATP synthase assembly protein I|nr:AtpZ/AtpI family protein [Mariniphaga sp.]